MKAGILAVRRHLFESIDFPSDRKALIHFVPADGSDEIPLDRCGQSLALICDDCRLVVLDLRSEAPDIRTDPDDRSEETVCLSCQGMIPAGSDTCPNCGWSYNEDESETG
jgi:hypothetical protein